MYPHVYHPQNNYIQNLIGWLILISIIFFIYSLIKNLSNKTKKKINQKSLIDEIFRQANTDRCWTISSSVGRRNHASVFIHRYSGKEERFGFREHGYDYLILEGIIKLYKVLEEKKTRGKLHYSYEEVGGYSDTVTSFSSGFTPGGGTDYYANTVGAILLMCLKVLHYILQNMKISFAKKN